MANITLDILYDNDRSSLAYERLMREQDYVTETYAIGLYDRFNLVVFAQDVTSSYYSALEYSKMTLDEVRVLNSQYNLGYEEDCDESIKELHYDLMTSHQIPIISIHDHYEVISRELTYHDIKNLPDVYEINGHSQGDSTLIVFHRKNNNTEEEVGWFPSPKLVQNVFYNSPITYRLDIEDDSGVVEEIYLDDLDSYDYNSSATCNSVRDTLTKLGYDEQIVNKVVSEVPEYPKTI